MPKDSQPNEQRPEVPLDEVRRGSDAVEQSIEEIRVKMETFTDLVRPDLTKYHQVARFC